MMPCKLFWTNSWTPFSLPIFGTLMRLDIKSSMSNLFCMGCEVQPKIMRKALVWGCMLRWAFANVAGCFLDPVLLFTGAESNKASMQKMVQEAGFENALVLMKKGKASMDDKLFSVLLDWFANCLNERGFTGKHILFIDNHDSHERSQPIQLAMRHNIILMTFPSHCAPYSNARPIFF